MLDNGITNKVDNYIVIDGKKIELSDETVENIKKTILYNDPVKEFIEILKYKVDDLIINEYVDDNGCMEIKVIDNKYLFVEFPVSNDELTFCLFNTIKEFCEFCNGTNKRYPVFDKKFPGNGIRISL